MRFKLPWAPAGRPEQPWWSYQLPAELEQRFIRETEPTRFRQLRVWTVFAMLQVWLTVLVDINTMPDEWQLAVFVRLLLITPAFVTAWPLLKPTRPRWQRSLAAVAPHSVTQLAFLVMLALTANFDPARSILLQSLSTVWACMLIPLGMLGSVAFAAIGLVGGDTILFSACAAHNVAVTQPEMMVVGHVFALMSLLGRFLHERETRRGFLLGLRLQEETEKLTRTNAALTAIAQTDALTGLANRRHFDQSFAAAWRDAELHGWPIAVMMIDVDYFKKFNDTAGHQEGDRCLALVARTIAGQIRGPSDLAARFGGEEFVVMLPQSDAAGALSVAERVRAAIAALKVFHPGRMGEGFVSVSIGVAAMTPGTPDAVPEALLATADSALYAAKHAGRNCVEAASPAAAAPAAPAPTPSHAMP